MGIKRNVEKKRKRDKRKREENERKKNERDVVFFIHTFTYLRCYYTTA